MTAERGAKAHARHRAGTAGDGVVLAALTVPRTPVTYSSSTFFRSSVLMTTVVSSGEPRPGEVA